MGTPSISTVAAAPSCTIATTVVEVGVLMAAHAGVVPDVDLVADCKSAFWVSTVALRLEVSALALLFLEHSRCGST